MSKLGTIFRVAYNPNISDFLFKKLRESTPSMVSNDESTAQYNVDDFIKSLEGYELTEKEQEFLQELIDNNIDYIEV